MVLLLLKKRYFQQKKGEKHNFWKNRPCEVNKRAMPIGKMVLFFILPLGNPEIHIHYTTWSQVEQAFLIPLTLRTI